MARHSTIYYKRFGEEVIESAERDTRRWLGNERGTARRGPPGVTRTSNGSSSAPPAAVLSTPIFRLVAVVPARAVFSSPNPRDRRQASHPGVANDVARLAGSAEQRGKCRPRDFISECTSFFLCFFREDVPRGFLFVALSFFRTLPLLLFSYAPARRTCPGKRRNVVGRGARLGIGKKEISLSLDGAVDEFTLNTSRITRGSFENLEV